MADLKMDLALNMQNAKKQLHDLKAGGLGGLALGVTQAAWNMTAKSSVGDAIGDAKDSLVNEMLEQILGDLLTAIRDFTGSIKAFQQARDDTKSALGLGAKYMTPEAIQSDYKMRLGLRQGLNDASTAVDYAVKGLGSPEGDDFWKTLEEKINPEDKLGSILDKIGELMTWLKDWKPLG